MIRHIFNLLIIAINAVVVGGDRSSKVAFESIDLIELNHFYDSKGSLIFDQVIFWEWNQADSVYKVREWRMAESLTIMRYPGRFATIRWRDLQGNIDRSVSSRFFRESWTQVDPERADIKNHPLDCRKQFIKAKVQQQ